MTGHRSRVCHFVIDCDDLDRAVAFWSAALDATEEPLSEKSRHIYRRLRLPDAEIRVLLVHRAAGWPAAGDRVPRPGVAASDPRDWAGRAAHP